MNADIVRLCADDYDEALDFLNLVFSMNARPHDFQKMLPVMWARDDEHMRKHLAVKRDGKIRALLGVYPLPTIIGGKPLLFSTVGNVATHPYEEGKGYMSALLAAAMEALEELGADASRLGGRRQRYNRYGYEPAGSNYVFTLTAHNALRFPNRAAEIAFAPLEPTDATRLKAARALYESGGIAVRRPGDKGFFQSLTAWRNVPFAALNPDGKMIGYLTADAEGGNLAEQRAESPERLTDMLCAWLAWRGRGQIQFTLAPWQGAEARLCQRLCEGWSVVTPSSFFIRHWAEVLDALLALKVRDVALPEGEATVEIEGYGAVKLTVDGNGAHCARTDDAACLTLDRLDAARFFLGPLPPVCSGRARGEAAKLLNAWLPLPLSWSTLDRV